MTARKDRKGRFHNILDQPALTADQAEEIKRKLGLVDKAAERAEAAAKIHRAARKRDKP